MIDEHSLDETGWARFSNDKRLRFRLGRKLTPRSLDVPWPSRKLCCLACGVAPYRHALDCSWAKLVRVVFVMLNPSDADAFRLDPTVQKCCKFATLWGADVLEVVNGSAFRSPNPKLLYPMTPAGRGSTPENDAEIRAACRHAFRVIAAWGNHGALDGRGEEVRTMLQADGIELMHLGMTGDGFPLHPLARGKAFIPLTREPVLWTA